MLHLGDNIHSDYNVPVGLGIKAALLPDHYRCPHVSGFADAAIDKLGSNGSFKSSSAGAALRDLQLEHGHQEFWHALGLYTASPLVFGFAQWVSAYVDRHKIDKVVFLARDGWLPRMAFQKLRPDVPCDYAYLTRAVLTNAGLCNMSEAVLRNLVSGVPAPSSDYVKRLGPVAEFLEPKRKAFMGGDPFVASEGDRRRLASFFLSEAETLKEYGRHSKNILLRYLEELQVLDTANVAFVDVGWAGTAATLLSELCPNAESWHFLYFGTLPHFEPRQAKHSALFFQFGLPEPNTALVLECLEVVELLFTAPENSALSLVLEEDRVVPLFSEDTPQKVGQREFCRQIESGAKIGIDYLTSYLQRHPGFQIDVPAMFSVLEAALRTEDLVAVEMLARVSHQLGLGNSKEETLISDNQPYWKVIRKWLRGKEFKQKGHVYWQHQGGRAFIARQKGLKLGLAKWAYNVKKRGGLKTQLKW